MKVRMKDILKNKEKITIPLYFCGDETKEFVELDTDSIYEELKNKLKGLEVKK